MRRLPCLALALALLPTAAFADTPRPDSGDTAWLLVATGWVLMMTLPGLALFYGGLVRARNVLSVAMQCLAIVALVSVLWVAYGYSLAFDTSGMVVGEFGRGSVIGGLGKAWFAGVGREALVGTVPEVAFAAFQLTFAAITPALIVGAVAERMRFGPLLVFCALWFTFAYLPVAHMTWAGAGGLFWDWGVLDFAGGTVVHVNAGVAALVACLWLGRRRGWPQQPMPPHNLMLTLAGTGLLWVGWFGFNAGSALAANGSAAMALLVTQVAAATATLAWLGAEWIAHGKPSLLGAASGAVAGLVAITPASGSCGPMGAVAIGAVAGVGCFLAATRLKRRFGYDDALDVFGVHGIGGVLGALLTAVFAMKACGGVGLAEGMSLGGQLWAQAKAIAVTGLWSAGVTAGSLLLISCFAPLRVDAEGEHDGLDLTLHDERGYTL